MYVNNYPMHHTELASLWERTYSQEAAECQTKGSQSYCIICMSLWKCVEHQSTSTGAISKSGIKSAVVGKFAVEIHLVILQSHEKRDMVIAVINSLNSVPIHNVSFIDIFFPIILMNIQNQVQDRMMMDPSQTRLKADATLGLASMLYHAGMITMIQLTVYFEQKKNTLWDLYSKLFW